MKRQRNQPAAGRIVGRGFDRQSVTPVSALEKLLESINDMSRNWTRETQADLDPNLVGANLLITSFVLNRYPPGVRVLAPTPMWWEIDDKGLIRMRGSLVEMLDGIEADRVRYCAACPNLFYARRKDQRGCSKGCANVIRARKFREEHPNANKQYKAAAKAARAAQNAAKKRKKRKANR